MSNFTWGTAISGPMLCPLDRLPAHSCSLSYPWAAPGGVFCYEIKVGEGRLGSHTLCVSEGLELREREGEMVGRVANSKKARV